MRDLFDVAHKDAAGPVDHVRLHASGDQTHDLLLQTLAVDVALLVPDHEIDSETLQAPPGMCLHQLAHQFDVVGAADLHQHDRQVARYCVAPQARLAAAVAHQYAPVGAQAGLRVDHRAGQAPVELRIGFAGIELAQHHLRMRPRELEYAVGETSVMVLLGQRQTHAAALTHAFHHIDGHGLIGRERDDAAARRDRVQHRAGRVRQRPCRAERPRRLQRTAAADEARAIGLVRDRTHPRFGRARHAHAVHSHQVEHPRRCLLGRARAARAQHGRRSIEDLGLHEQLAEGRVQFIRDGTREHDLGVAGHLDRAAHVAVVGDAQAPQLDVVLR